MSTSAGAKEQVVNPALLFGDQLQPVLIKRVLHQVVVNLNFPVLVALAKPATIALLNLRRRIGHIHVVHVGRPLLKIHPLGDRLVANDHPVLTLVKLILNFFL